MVMDSGTNSIRKISPAGAVTTLPVKGFKTDNGGNLAIDPAGNIFIVNWGSEIYKVAPDGTSIIFAGGETGDRDGLGREARFNGLGGIICDAQGNVYVTDRRNHKVRKISPAGLVSTVPGTGPLEEPGRSYLNILEPSCLVMDQAGNLLVASHNHIYKVNPSTGKVTDYAYLPETKPITNMALDAAGNLYATILNESSVKRVSPDQQVTLVAGTGRIGYKDGKGPEAEFYWPQGIAVSSDNTSIYVADATNYRIRKIEIR